MTDPYSTYRPPSSSGYDPSARSIFPKGRAFSLDDFSNRDFIVKDFIESLTDFAQPTRRSLSTTGVPTGSGTAANFDAKPLIRAFEQASKRLAELSGELEQKEIELSAAVRRAEAQHASNADTLGRKLNQTIDSFQKLDTTLKSDRGERWGGNVAVDTGRRLEELDRQKLRANDAHFLIRCWNDISHGDGLPELQRLRRSHSGEDRIRAARIAKQLLRICQRLDQSANRLPNGTSSESHATTDGAPVAAPPRTPRETIDQFIEELEKDMLDLFEQQYRRQNFEEMKNCATVLQDFNGGASVQAQFVNTNPFFIERANLVADDAGFDQDMWMQLSDPDAEMGGIDPGLQSLIEDAKIVIQDESSIIKKAFPIPEQVLGKFLQRIFQQSIQQRLEAVLEKAESESPLAYLRSLRAARSSINSLVEDLKSHGLTEYPDTIAPQTSQLLDQQVEELFTPYFGGSAYIEKELYNLQGLYRSLLFKFEMFHMRRQKEPKTYLATLRNRGQELIASAREATDQYVKNLDLERLSSTQKRILMSVAGVSSGGTDKQLEIELSEEDGRLNMNSAKRMIKWLAEGVRRGLEVGGGAETPKDVAALQQLLVRTMGDKYVDLALDAAADAASAAEGAKRDPPDLTYLAHLKTAISIMYLLQSCIDTLLVPLASTSLTTRRDMEKLARVSLTRMEDHVNVIEQRTIDAVSNWTARLLTQQLRQDFRPREEAEAGLSLSSTSTCASVCKFLSSFHTLAAASFAAGSSNLNTLLTEVALEFRAQLLEHFKKWQVNRLGAIMLVRDISAYTDLLRAWHIEDPGFNAGLEVLSEIGGLFVLRPDAVRERLGRVGAGQGGGGSGSGNSAGGGAAGTTSAGAGTNQAATTAAGPGWVLAGISRENLRPYLMKREDYMEVGMQSVLHSL